MVGGMVVEVIDTVMGRPDVIWVNCMEIVPCGTRKRFDTCAVYVIKNALSQRIRAGDSLWWQGDYAMWTPCDVREGGHGESDIQIRRVGYSGMPRPIPI